MKKKVSKKVETANNAKANVSSSAIVRKSTYTIEWQIKADGSTALKRNCDGFNAFELLGLLDLISREIREQIQGKIKPDIIERNVVRGEK